MATNVSFFALRVGIPHYDSCFKKRLQVSYKNEEQCQFFFYAGMCQYSLGRVGDICPGLQLRTWRYLRKRFCDRTQSHLYHVADLKKNSTWLHEGVM